MPIETARPELQIDIAHDCTVGELFSFMESYSAAIVNYQAIGPAGGNPLVTFSFPDIASLHLFKSTYQVGFCNPVSMVTSSKDEDRQPSSQDDQPE